MLKKKKGDNSGNCSYFWPQLATLFASRIRHGNRAAAVFQPGDELYGLISLASALAVMLLGLINVLFVMLLAAAAFILINSENVCTKTN